MPTTKAKPKTTKKVGGGLKKKIGPLPVWGWVAVAGGVILVYYLYSKNKSASPATGATDTNLLPTANVTPQQAASAGTPSPNSPLSLTPDVLSSLGIQPAGDYTTNSDLQSQLGMLGSELGAQIAAMTFPTPVVNITTTTPKGSASKATVTPATQTKSKVPAKKIVYYTYKKSVKIAKGQTIHYAKGRGYYAA
jgi:hypothetical protein